MKRSTKDLFKLIGYAIMIPIAIAFVCVFFVLGMCLLVAFALALIIYQLAGVPLKVTSNGKRIGEIRRFKYHAFAPRSTIR